MANTDPIKISDSQYFEKYRKHLISREADGKAVSEKSLAHFNRLGYLGVYQMGVEALVTAGYLTEKAGKKFKRKELGFSQKDILLDNENWTKGNSFESFSADENIQTEALKKHTQNNYQSLKSSFKDKNINDEEVFAYLTGAHLSGAGNMKKFLNGDKTFKDKNETTITNYIDSYKKAANLPINKDKVFGKLSDKESLSKYKEYSIELAENRDAEFKKKIDPKTANDNDVAIREKYQRELGNENLTQGHKLYNEEVTKTFKETNPHYKKISIYNKKINELKRKRDSGEYGKNPDVTEKTEVDQKAVDKVNSKIKILEKIISKNPSNEKYSKQLSNLNDKKNKLLSGNETTIEGESLGKKDLDSQIELLNSKRKASFANIRIEQNDKNASNLKNIIKTADVDSDEYKKAVGDLRTVEDSNKELRSGFKKKEQADLEFHVKSGKEYLIDNKDVFSKELYSGDIIQNVDDLIPTEKLDLRNIDYDENNGDGGRGSDGGGSDGGGGESISEEQKLKRKNQYNFLTEANEDDNFGNDPYNFTDDEKEEQSAKGFLKDNPMSFLTAALGVKGLMDSQSDIPSMEIDDKTALSESFYEHLNNLETISKQGFTPAEEAAHLKKVNDGYMASVDLAVQASGGNRAQVLSQAGQLNANKNDALLDFASNDAKLNRANIEKYGQALEYKEAFTERKDVRRQTNEYREKAADFEQAIQKRQGGAALAAGSIKSLVDSIKTYKETGPGSALDKALSYMNNKRKFDGMQENPDTKKPFKNIEEFQQWKSGKQDLNKNLKSSSALFKEKMISNKTNTQEDITSILSRVQSTTGKERLNLMDKFDPSTGLKGLDLLQKNPNQLNETLQGVDFTPLDNKIEEDNAYQDPFKGLYS